MMLTMSMKVKVTIRTGSKSEKVLKQMSADKAAFREAVTSGKISAYTKTRETKPAEPVSVK